MNTKNYIIFLFILITLLYFCLPMSVNSKKSQEQSKKRFQKKMSKNTEGIIKTNKKRRRMDDEEVDEDIDPTLLVYNRCDHGHTPDDISDCTKYSTSESSCCIFTYGQDTGCVLIGFKYLGSKSVGDMTVNCYNKYLESFNIFWIIILFFIFIN